MALDFLTLGVGVFSFGIFLLIHVISFRWIRPEELLKSLFACILAITLLPLVIMGVLFTMKLIEVSILAWIIASFLSLSVAGMLCFTYVLCIFGPYETSIRMRLVREFAKGGTRGITCKELSDRYSDRTIVDIRLRRLIGSGDIIEKNGFYLAGSKRNFFFAFDAIALVIKKWIGR